ncbi:MAG TPA: glycoside hydrolase family 3 C-terminal domain-containing protein, partial [Bryobacteraceae bacterium]|nr:glycoside hydrolase family 3 C-terminal domain-containing protein [Bryobacteraceae bacterium]
VRALEAGADTLLMPADPDVAIRAVVAAVENGRITRTRIRESVVRILAAKERTGLDRKRFVDLEGIGDVVDSPEDNARAQEIADRAVTLVRNEGGVVPLNPAASVSFLVLTESRGSQQGKVLAAEVRKRMPNASITMLDPTAAESDLEQAAASTQTSAVTVVAAFVSVAAYRGSVALAGGYPALLNRVLANGKPVILVALGSPYLLRNFPIAGGYLTTYSTVAPSEIAAVKALFGEISIQGRLPVTIPGLAKYGDGIQLGGR